MAEGGNSASVNPQMLHTAIRGVFLPLYFHQISCKSFLDSGPRNPSSAIGLNVIQPLDVLLACVLISECNILQVRTTNPDQSSILCTSIT
jgi:hypothetical protein